MKRFALVAVLLLAPALAQAATCPTFPYILTNGQTADANQVMSNFNSLLTCSNTKLAESGANFSITSLSGMTTPLSVLQGGTGNTTGAATLLSPGATLAITGDLAWTSPAFTGASNVTAAGTLATVNTNVGAFGSATQVPNFTVNAKGLITAAGSTSLPFSTGAQVIAGTSTTTTVTPASLTSQQSIGANGYTTLPGGLILEWGLSGFASGGGGTVTVTYPLAFTTATYSVTITPTFAGTVAQAQDTVNSVSTTNFVAENRSDVSSEFFWMAIGK